MRTLKARICTGERQSAIELGIPSRLDLGVWLPLICLLTTFLFRPWGWALWLIYPLQFLRQIVRNQGAMTDRATLALFQLLARFPEGLGQIRFLRDPIAGHQAGLIDTSDLINAHRLSSQPISHCQPQLHPA